MEKPSKHVSIITHHPVEGLGIIADVLKRAAITSRHIRSFEGQPIPREIGDAAGLIIMGGPQSVYEQDKFPWLRDELRLIEDALKQTRPILGVCLGSQLLAAALGANVYAGRTKEIGWNRVTLTNSATGGTGVPACDRLFSGEPSSFIGFHWHGDIFDLPRGGTLLASSALTAHQAFRYGTNAYGTLFHMEVTLPQIDKMIETFSSELRSAGLSGSAIKLSAHTHLPALQKISREVFARWVALL
jgi:GMP synthase (glutamine-hydrolysing)